MRLEESIEARSYREESDGHHDRHQAVGEDSASRTLLVAGGQIALDNRLVAGVADEVVGQAAEDDDPPSGIDEVEGILGIEEEEAELIVLGGNLPEVRSTVIARVHNQIHRRKNSSPDKNDTLNDVAPHNSLYPTHRAIENGDESHQRYTDIYIDTRDGSHGEGRQEENQCRAGHHEDDEQDAGHQARGRVEAAFEVLISGGDVQPAEERQIIPDDGERHQKDTNLHGIVRPVGGVGLGGNTHIGDGAEHRGKDADARCPPGNATAPLEEVVGGIGGTLHEVVTQIDHS